MRCALWSSVIVRNLHMWEMAPARPPAGWETLAAYRQTAPWFTRIGSNIFNVLLRRPAYTYRKYGYFLITESWVASHFAHLLAACNGWVGSQGYRRLLRGAPDYDPHHGTDSSTDSRTEKT